MSYISFYRKWRPQAFSEVIGQEHIVKTLQNAISKNRLVHGYMFCGPKGTGKTSIARIFAKAINCVNGPAIEPCNKCDNCISITAGSNVDIVEIDGASNRGIENIRDLREKIKFLPVFLRKKIYIIDEAHQITDAAFNALLKTLEEPPEHVIFVMATTDPGKVIKTIMSRCQRFDFEPISLEGLRHRLKDIASSENIDITDSAISIVAKYSDGSLRDAEGILEQLSSFSDGRITVDDVSSILGIIDQDMLFELANIILEKNISQGLLFVSRLFSTSFSLNAFISEFLEHLYSLYVIKNYENPADILDMPDDFKKNYYNQAGLFTSWQLESLINLFSGLLAQIKESENPKTFFKAAVIKALNTEAIKSGQEAKSGQAIKSNQAPNNLKIINQDGRQSKNEKVELNTERKSTAEITVPKNLNVETLDTAESTKAREISVQKEMAEADNAPGGETVQNAPGRETAENFPEMKTTKDIAGIKAVGATLYKAAAKNAAENASGSETTGVLSDKAVIKDSTERAPDKEAAKATIDKEAAVTAPYKAAAKNKAENSSGVEMAGEALDKDVDKKDTGTSLQIIPEIWETVLIKIKAKSVPLQAVLKEVKRFRVQENKIFFSLESKNIWHKDELNKIENRVSIQELLKSLTGEMLEITFDFINDKNISESIDLVRPAKRIRASGDLPTEHNLTAGDLHSDHKDIPGFGAESMNAGLSSPEVDADRGTAAPTKSPDGKDAIEGSETYGYFEEKFKVKEK